MLEPDPGAGLGDMGVGGVMRLVIAGPCWVLTVAITDRGR